MHRLLAAKKFYLFVLPIFISFLVVLFPKWLEVSTVIDYIPDKWVDWIFLFVLSVVIWSIIQLIRLRDVSPQKGELVSNETKKLEQENRKIGTPTKDNKVGDEAIGILPIAILVAILLIIRTTKRGKSD